MLIAGLIGPVILHSTSEEGMVTVASVKIWLECAAGDPGKCRLAKKTDAKPARVSDVNSLYRQHGDLGHAAVPACSRQTGAAAQIG